MQFPVRPEVLGVIGLVIAGLAALALFLRIRPASDMHPLICPHCGTMQHDLSRPSALAYQLVGTGRCISCGQPLSSARG